MYKYVINTVGSQIIAVRYFYIGKVSNCHNKTKSFEIRTNYLFINNKISDNDNEH